MATEADPIQGEWYVNRNDGLRFQIVGIDEDEDALDIMHEDGEREALPLQEWYAMTVEPAEQPAYPAANMDSDDSEGPELDYPAADPFAAKVPDDDEIYRRRNVEYANKAAEGYPGDKSESEEQGWGNDEEFARISNRRDHAPDE